MSPTDLCHCKHPRSDHSAFAHRMCERKLRTFGPPHGSVCPCLAFRPRVAQGKKYEARRFLRPSTFADIQARSRMGYPGSGGTAARFEQSKADVAALVAEVENLQRAVSGFLAQIPPLGIKSPAPANDGRHHGGTDGNGSDAGVDEGHPRSDREHHRSKG